jgi:RsbT co-antagonist protein rsbRD N-terminal domain
VNHPDQLQLNQIAAHLRTQREKLVESWRAAIKQDPEITSSFNLSGTALDDHIVKILVGFERRVRADYSPRATEVDMEQRENAAEHADERFLKGYDVRETLREWSHLQQVVLGELERYAIVHPELEDTTLAAARQIITTAFSESMVESAAQHVRHLRAGPSDGL